MSVTTPQGFRASGVAAGIKESGAPDLAVVATTGPSAAAAATFTTNRACAAPVTLSRSHLEASGGRVQAIVLNSGCANAATGPEGMAGARETCDAAAAELGCPPEEILVCSTGLIGVPLPFDRLLGALPGAVGLLGSSVEAGRRAAEAIMTTDTHPKEVLIERAGVRVGGMAKGAGMIAPNMATMLAVLTTDADAEPALLQSLLREAVAESFNALIVDGCTSTNDTVALLASGVAGPSDPADLRSSLIEACADLAEQLAADAEGTTKVARIQVTGATSNEDARLAARGIALSLLVKTSLFGADPYWGRILSEVGASGAAMEMDRIQISYGSVPVFGQGRELPHDRAEIVEYLSAPAVGIRCDLGLGTGESAVLTTDLGHGYIDENMRTS